MTSSSTLSFHPEVEELTSDLRPRQIAEVLSGLSFTRPHRGVRTVTIDAGTRDYIVRALQRRYPE